MDGMPNEAVQGLLWRYLCIDQTYATTTLSERVYSPLPTCLQNILKWNEALIRIANIVVAIVVVVAEASNCEKLKACIAFDHLPDRLFFAY